MGIKEGASALWYSELSQHQLGSLPTVFIPRWTTHLCILYQVWATRGAADAGTGDLGVLTTHETSPWFPLGDAGSIRPG